MGHQNNRGAVCFTGPCCTSVSAVRISPNNELIVTGDYNGRVRILGTMQSNSQQWIPVTRKRCESQPFHSSLQPPATTAQILSTRRFFPSHRPQHRCASAQTTTILCWRTMRPTFQSRLTTHLFRQLARPIARPFLSRRQLLMSIQLRMPVMQLLVPLENLAVKFLQKMRRVVDRLRRRVSLRKDEC
ncbi:hypothetical protein BKA93DRAFT_492725 [Sparassis latifolia]